MCTSLTLSTPDGRRIFGRTLDLESHFGEQVTLTRSSYRPPLSTGGSDDAHLALVFPSGHYALLGMATVVDGYPLYAEAMNDRGLAMAGLRFARHARYADVGEAVGEVPLTALGERIWNSDAHILLAPWELIPFLLGHCATVEEAEATLQKVRVVSRPFVRADGTIIPPAPLHWHVVDRYTGRDSLVVEVTEAGMQVYPNPAGVLTNDPTFPEQMAACAPYLWMEPERVGGRRPPLTVQGDDLTLPGGYDSAARFIRAAYLRHVAEAHLHTVGGMVSAGRAVTDATDSSTQTIAETIAETAANTISETAFAPESPSVAEDVTDHVFRILGAIAPPPGAVLTERGEAHRTLYTAVLDLAAGRYVCVGEDMEPLEVRFDEAVGRGACPIGSAGCSAGMSSGTSSHGKASSGVSPSGTARSSIIDSRVRVL